MRYTESLHFVRSLAVCCGLVTAMPVLADAVDSDSETSVAREIERIDVYPGDVVLASQRSYVQLVITGFSTDGEPRDVTSAAKMQIGDSTVAALDGTRVVPLQDGNTSVDIRYGSHTARIPVRVIHQHDPEPIRFQTEVLAAVTKQGCNSGSCHGSPQGKNGFSLSLMAYSAELDQEALIHGGLARRTNPIEPMQSLLLKKPLLRVAHVGGKRLRKTDLAFRILHDWISEGATSDPADTPACVGMTVYPHQARVLEMPNGHQQLNVVARFSDGTERDVTRIAAYQTSDKAVLTCDADGRVTGGQRGFAAVMVRYLSQVESVNFTVVKHIDEFDWTDPPAANYVDELVHARLRHLQYLPSDLADDATFVRRVFLDLTGLLPRPDQARAFLEDESPDKRSRLIDRLLDSVEFARFWTNKTADIMRLSKQTLPDGRAELFSDWIRDSWRNNQPFDEFAESILTASGDTKTTAPANYFFAISDPDELTETTTQLFMGSRIGCAKCHNHPFENWTQDDYYRIAAVFARTKNDGGTIVLKDKGEAKNPQTGRTMQPWGLHEERATEPTDDVDRRAVFTEWLTRDDNQFFARVEVNRIWSRLFGRGIVEPVDDFRSSNPASNPDLLDALAADFRESGYDRRRIIRTICNSRTYQRSSATNAFNANDAFFFSHYPARPLTAEQLHDAIGFATRTLAPTPSISGDLADASAKLEELIRELPGRYADWELAIANRLAEHECWQGNWRFTDAFQAGSFEEAWADSFGPEEDLNFTWDTTYPGGKAPMTWKPQAVWVDGAQHVALAGGPGPRYQARRIYTMRPGTAVIDFGTTGAVKVWLNGREVYADATDRGLHPDDHHWELDLTSGINTLLIKTVNSSMMWGFQYELKSFVGQSPVRLQVTLTPGEGLVALTRGLSINGPGTVDIDVDTAEVVAIPPEQRSDAQAESLRQLQESTNKEIQAARDRVARLTDWLDYQTQRTWPDSNNQFLSAFGQPRRESSCACERRTEPTIDQSLEMLNGEFPQRSTVEGARRYAGIADDRQLVADIYFAAFMRRPNEHEIDTAAKYLTEHSDRNTAIQDLLWAVINTREFSFQH